MTAAPREAGAVDLPELPMAHHIIGASHDWPVEREFYTADQMHTYARAALAAGLGVPPGWKLVPGEPTRPMLDALYGLDFMRFEDAYAAMLAAAPLPSAPSSAGVA